MAKRLISIFSRGWAQKLLPKSSTKGIPTKVIVEDKNLEFATKWDRRTNLVYTEQDIDEVRAERAKHVLKFPQM